MDRSDRMVVDLLNHYAFVLHEDVRNLTDEEIDIARNFADNYLKEDWKWEDYDSKFISFVNQQRFKAITSCDYKKLEKIVYDKISLVNGVMGVKNWDFNVYYNVDYEGYLLLAKPDQYGCYGDINIVYNFNDNTLSACKIKRTDEMEELGNINSKDHKKLKRKATIDIKI